jgi:hypothetical protein
MSSLFDVLSTTEKLLGNRASLCNRAGARRSPTAIRTRAVCGHERVLVPGSAGRSFRGTARPRIRFNEVWRSQRTSRAGGSGPVHRSAGSRTALRLTRPSLRRSHRSLRAYATLWESDGDRVSTTVYEQAVLSHLIEQTAPGQPWWATSIPAPTMSSSTQHPESL